MAPETLEKWNFSALSDFMDNLLEVVEVKVPKPAVISKTETEIPAWEVKMSHDNGVYSATVVAPIDKTKKINFSSPEVHF